MVDFNKQFGKPRRIYQIPAKIRLYPKTFEKFKHWVSEQKGVVINQEEPFCFQRANGRHCRSFKDLTCTRDFLRVCRNFLISEMGYYPVATRPTIFYDRRRLAK
jgi:hypothetical protein